MLCNITGNPFPPLLPENRNQNFWLHNVLLEEAKREFRSSKASEIPQHLGAEEKI